MEKKRRPGAAILRELLRTAAAGDGENAIPPITRYAKCGGKIPDGRRILEVEDVAVPVKTTGLLEQRVGTRLRMPP